MFDAFDDIMTVEEVGEAMKIGTTQAYRMVRSKQLKAFKEGKDWKVPKEALIEYIREKSNLTMSNSDKPVKKPKKEAVDNTPTIAVTNSATPPKKQTKVTRYQDLNPHINNKNIDYNVIWMP